MNSTLYYLVPVLIVLLFILNRVRKNSYENFLIRRYNRKTLEIIREAPLMTGYELNVAHDFLYNEDIARKIKLNLWDSATSMIVLREKILAAKKKKPDFVPPAQNPYGTKTIKENK